MSEKTKKEMELRKESNVYVDDTEFDDPNRFKPSDKSIDEINEELAHAIFEEGLLAGKSYEEVLEYVKNM